MSGMIITGQTTSETVIDFEFARRVGERLELKYPGYLWHVHASGGVVNVLLGNTLRPFGFTLNYVNSYSASQVDKDVDMLAGELLERYRLKRGAADQNQIANASRDFAGRMAVEM